MREFFLILCVLSLFAQCKKERHPITSIPDDSLYQLDSEWKTQKNTVIHLRDLSGRVLIVGLIFTRCTAICPTIVADMKTIEKNIGWFHKDDVGFLLVSIDPTRDTPEAMRSYMKKMNLDESRWTFLQAKPPDVADLASLLGVKISPLPDGSFSHSRILTVLSPSGQIKFQDPRVSEDGANFAEAARQAADFH